jgi:hypothetical protein
LPVPKHAAPVGQVWADAWDAKAAIAATAVKMNESLRTILLPEASRVTVDAPDPRKVE